MVSIPTTYKNTWVTKTLSSQYCGKTKRARRPAYGQVGSATGDQWAATSPWMLLSLLALPPRHEAHLQAFLAATPKEKYRMYRTHQGWMDTKSCLDGCWRDISLLEFDTQVSSTRRFGRWSYRIRYVDLYRVTVPTNAHKCNAIGPYTQWTPTSFGQACGRLHGAKIQILVPVHQNRHRAPLLQVSTTYAHWQQAHCFMALRCCGWQYTAFVLLSVRCVPTSVSILTLHPLLIFD